MNYDLNWHPGQSEAIYSIALATIAFMVYWYTLTSGRLLRRLQKKLGKVQGQVRHILYRRLLGALFFGPIPAIVLMATQPYSMADYGFALRFTTFDLYWTLSLSVIIVFLTRYSAQKPHSLAMYPEIRRPEWTPNLLVQSNLSWMVYLLAYEMMFRGFLLFSCSRVMGVWPAITISTAIYVLAHVPKNETEGIGAIPLGVLFCLISLTSGTIWTPVLVHWVMSLSHEWYSLKYHPEIGLNSGK